MSRHNLRPFARPKAAAPLCALIALVAASALWIGCDSDNDSEAGLDKYFLRDAAAMQEAGLPVYWLGTEFTAEGSVFHGPYVDQFGAEVEGGGIAMDYLASVDGGNTRLGLTVYGSDAWELVKDRTNTEAIGVTRRAVSVQGRESELILQSAGARPLNAIWLVVDLGDVVAVANVNSGGAVSPGGPDYNPFINNPDLLVQVMQDLRPYPE